MDGELLVQLPNTFIKETEHAYSNEKNEMISHHILKLRKEHMKTEHKTLCSKTTSLQAKIQFPLPHPFSKCALS
jgi:hypothetical protein